MPAGRAPRLLLLIVLWVFAECGAAAGSVLELMQYQPVPQYRVLPQYPYQLVPPYQPAPLYSSQYHGAPQYQRPLPVPQAPVYEPGPYDNYNHGNGP